MVADITYPGVYQLFLNTVDFLNFDLTWMISVGCFVVVDFHAQFLRAHHDHTVPLLDI